MDDLMMVLPSAADLRTAAKILREEGQYEIAMRLGDTARLVAREERRERWVTTELGRDVLRSMGVPVEG